MKKILMMLLGVAFATCAWATVYTVHDPKAKGVHLVLGSGDPSYEGALDVWSAQSVYWTTTLMEESWSVQLPLVQTYSLAAFTNCGDGAFTYDLDASPYFAIVVTYDDANLSPGGSSKAYIVNTNYLEEHTFDLSTMTPIYTGNFGGVAPVKYMTWDEEAKSLVAATNTNYTVVTKDTAAFEDGKWYVVKDTIERGMITVKGEAHLILCDDASLTVTGGDGEAGIKVDSGKSLTIYGQSEGTGALIANAGIDGAGIGGSECLPSGTITINGATVTANGSPRGAGIGGGWCAYSYVVTINGGTITANGGTDSAGIGGGWGGSGGTVTINGGKITASSLGGAGIGAGTGPSSNNHGVITFAKGVVFSIVAGADESSATEKTVTEYMVGRSAKYVKIIEFGDIYAITPLSESGKIYKAGEKVQFQVRLLARNYDTPNPTAYQLVYTGSGTEAEDMVSNPPMLGIVVSGQLRGATITEVKPAAINGDQTVNPYTDLICEYVVQSGDLALPINLALDGSTVNLPIVPDSANAVSGFGYCLINGDKWDIRSANGSKSANLWFTSSSTAKNAKGFWNQLGTAVVDYKLAQADFQVNTYESVEYLDWDAGTKSLVAVTNQFCEVVTTETATFESNKWYVVTNTIERAGIKVDGEAHLILCDGASLTVTGDSKEAGIEVPENSALTIYGQCEGEGAGKLVAIANEGAGIGSSYDGTCGTITINGGTIAAISSGYGAGIGGSSWSDNGATITINGGTVKATGGEQGAGIGGGDYEDYADWVGIRSGADVITINGGEIEANGGLSAAGIGCGFNGFAATITINGGTIKATGGDYGAAIGSGEWNNSSVTITINGGEIEANGGVQGAGIGAGSYYYYGGSRSGTDTITINGGAITATGGQYAAGIGGGCSGFAATVTINGGTITASTTPNAGAEAIGSGYEPVSAATVTFGAALASKYVWAGASATTGEMMTTADFATNHSAVYAEVPIEIYTVAYDGNGAPGSMSNSVFAVSKEVTLKKNAFTAVGYDFAGWTTNGTDVVYADEAKDADFATTNATLTLTAKWNAITNGVTATSFTNLVNTIEKATEQASTLPITIGFTSKVEIPESATFPTLPTGTGFSGIKYVGDEEVGSNLYIEDGVLYGDVLRGEVTVDALRLMRYALGGPITSFQAISEGETTVTNAVVMLLGDNGKAYFNDTDDVDQMIDDVLAADPRPTTVKLYEVKGAIVTFEAMGGTIGSGTDPLGNDYDGGVESVTYLCMPDSGYQLPEEVTREGYTLKGWFDGWTNGDNEITNAQEIVNYSEHSLYAQWESTAPVQSEEGELHFVDLDQDGNPTKEIAAKEYATNTELKIVTTPIYLEKIGQRAFLNCSAMESLTLTATRDYDTLEPSTLEIDTMAFAGCTAIEELIIGGKVKLGAGAFQNCASLKKIIFLGDEAIEYADYALYLAGTKNGTGELKVYMSKDFADNNSTLVADFAKWNSAVTIVPKVDTKPVDGIGMITIPSGLTIDPGMPLAFIVQTTSNGKPDVDDVDIEYSTDLTNWSKLTEGTVKTAYPDGTVMIEVVVPNETTCFFRAVVSEE